MRSPHSTLLRAWARLSCAILFAILGVGTGFAQTCTFNPSQPNTASFGTVDPTLSTTYTWTVTVNYKCTGNASAAFTITGANDNGPAVYRLRNAAQPTQYMQYSVSTVDGPGTKITLTGQLVAANYRDAYVGNYGDTLTVLIAP